MKQAFLNIIIVFALLSIPAVVAAQTYRVDSSKKTMDVAGNFNGATVQLPAVESPPQYPGGKIAWQHFLRTQLDKTIPFKNRAVDGTYNVLIRFIVNDDGNLMEVGADSNCGYGLENEVIRCVKKSIKWIPAATTSGKKVRFTLRTMVIVAVKQQEVTVSFL